MNDEQQIIEPVPTLAGYKKIPTFKLWIANQFPYIETDFDAITNYELLQAVIKYLNTIIENENNVESNVTALYNAFVNLHNYVENFFENLDVQDEVNAKLDEMVDDGTLESILLNYTQITKTFDTYNDMMLDTSTYVNGMKLKTLGYYFINDGGGADYIVTNVQSDTKYQVSIGTNLWIELISDNSKFNVLQLGVQRNTENDQSTLINQLLQFPTKKTFYFPSGKYWCENSIVNNNRHDIIGEINTVTDFDRNINGTRFYFTNLENNTILLDCSNGSRCSIRDIYIICDNIEITLDKSLMSDGTNPVDIFTKTSKNTNVTGIKLGNYGNQLINVAVYGCNLGIYGGTYNIFENIGIICCETGLSLLADNVLTIAQIQRCETGIVLNANLNNISQTRLDSIRYNGMEINSNSNNIVNFIADICQYASIMLNNAQNNNIIGSIGRSGTYYANFEPSSEIDAGKACKVYLRNNCHNNSIKIMAYKSNALDVQSPVLKIPTYCIASGLLNDGNCANNNIEITGQLFDSSIPTNQLLTLEQLDVLLHRYKGYISGNLTFEGITYIITPTNNVTANNLHVIKPIKYNENYAILNANGNLDMSGKKITNVEEIRIGETTNGWVNLTRSSTQGNLKVQNMNASYQLNDAQITGVASPTTSTSAVNKDYVDNH